jgi:hypothetical protein
MVIFWKLLRLVEAHPNGWQHIPLPQGAVIQTKYLYTILLGF